MKTIRIAETATLLEASADREIWEAVLITPGEGSSGNYTEEMLREYGPKAFLSGAKSFFTHVRLEDGEPDPLLLWGVQEGDAWYEDGTGLRARIRVLESWRRKVAELAPHTALSIYAYGTEDDNGNVTLHYNRQNGTDMVVYPGRPGSQLAEAYIREALTNKDSADATVENDPATAGRQPESKKESDMDIKELAEKVESLPAAIVEAMKSEFGPLIEALKPAEAAEVDLAATVEAVAESGLPKTFRKAVIEAIVNGADAAEAIAAEQAKVEELRKELGTAAKADDDDSTTTVVGHVRGESGANGAQGDFRLSTLKGVA